ncbi:SulP family inorganic anion transporter [Marinobacter sp. C2H3]|uniref:SulP family inorganic anion transporter n=1 Tax=Marinobacter sp. C2H3 TaxID=3119003 RepID=UPI00300EB501
MTGFKRYLPILQWAPGYRPDQAASDLLAAVMVTVIMIPQALAYSVLAGLPPHVGLVASILPLVVYAVFGTSRSLSVGPMAITSLMTGAALAPIAVPGSPEYITAALLLAVMSGLMLLFMGVFRLGFLANFLSHPVTSGFVSASSLIIIASQIKDILGIDMHGQSLWVLGRDLFAHLGQTHWPTVAVGAASIVLLWGGRRFAKPALQRLGFTAPRAGLLSKTVPLLVVVLSMVVAWTFSLDERGVRLIGELSGGLPSLVLPTTDAGLWQQLAGSALLIGIVGFVGSLSSGQSLAAKRRERIDPDQELIGMGAANLASGLSGGMPVTASLSRSVVNFEAGAETPAAGAYAAVCIALTTLFLTPAIAWLPRATLAAVIIVSVSTLIDVRSLVRTWRYSLADVGAMLATIALTLAHSVEAGILGGVVLSVGLYLFRTSRPHVAVVGRVPDTEHFRNIRRYDVQLCPNVAFLRVDESLYFANARFLEETVLDLVTREPALKDLVLVCSGINLVDASALKSLETINERLRDAGVHLHLSEVKGPVMDRLKRTDLLDHLEGRVFLSTFDAWRALAPSGECPPAGVAP